MPFFLGLLLLFALPAQRPTDIVKWSAVSPPKAIAAGGTAKIELTAKVEEGWKLYALSQPKGGPVPLEILLDKGTPFTLVQRQITGPLPKIHNDVNFKLETQYYEGEAVFTVPITISKAATGKRSVPLDITFQVCGAEICLRPFTHRLNVELTITR